MINEHTHLIRIPNTVRTVCFAEKIIQRNIEVFRIPQERFWRRNSLSVFIAIDTCLLYFRKLAELVLRQANSLTKFPYSLSHGNAQTL